MQDEHGIVEVLIRTIGRRPDKVTYDQFGQVMTLDFSGCGLTQLPREITQLKAIQELRLVANRFEQFPPELGEMASLRVLNLAYNKIAQIPPEILHLSQLRVLNFPRIAQRAC